MFLVKLGVGEGAVEQADRQVEGDVGQVEVVGHLGGRIYCSLDNAEVWGQRILFACCYFLIWNLACVILVMGITIVHNTFSSVQLCYGIWYWESPPPASR